jgi:hypothetical protein
MTQSATSAAQECIFCEIVARQAEASVVYEDETVVVFMDLNPVTPGHLLVVPCEHAVGLEDLDGATSAHVWSVGHDHQSGSSAAVRCCVHAVFLGDLVSRSRPPSLGRSLRSRRMRSASPNPDTASARWGSRLRGGRDGAVKRDFLVRRAVTAQVNGFSAQSRAGPLV